MACCAWADAGPGVGHYIRTTRSPSFLAGHVESGQLVLSRGRHGRVRFAIELTWASHPNDGSFTHVGSATGEFAVKKRVAVFVDAETDCALVFHFQPQQVVVTQWKPCLFGANVDASGTYVPQGQPWPRSRRSRAANHRGQPTTACLGMPESAVNRWPFPCPPYL